MADMPSTDDIRVAEAYIAFEWVKKHYYPETSRSETQLQKLLEAYAKALKAIRAARDPADTVE